MRTTWTRMISAGGILALGALSLGGLAGCGPEYPNCDNDEDCHEGEFCVNGLCQQCREDTDCGPGQQCSGGACEAIPGYCTSTSDCGPNEECQNNRCTPVETASFTPTPDPPAAQCSFEPIYFGFDEDDLDQAARSVIQQNLSCMQERGATSAHLTGHADPRGTEEYNLALGDRRARSVARYLESLGGADVTHSSMGEEMARGSDEGSWRRDRKVEFVTR